MILVESAVRVHLSFGVSALLSRVLHPDRRDLWVIFCRIFPPSRRSVILLHFLLKHAVGRNIKALTYIKKKKELLLPLHFV